MLQTFIWKLYRLGSNIKNPKINFIRSPSVLLPFIKQYKAEITFYFIQELIILYSLQRQFYIQPKLKTDS